MTSCTVPLSNGAAWVCCWSLSVCVSGCPSGVVQMDTRSRFDNFYIFSTYLDRGRWGLTPTKVHHHLFWHGHTQLHVILCHTTWQNPPQGLLSVLTMALSSVYFWRWHNLQCYSHVWLWIGRKTARFLEELKCCSSECQKHSSAVSQTLVNLSGGPQSMWQGQHPPSPHQSWLDGVKGRK